MNGDQHADAVRIVEDAIDASSEEPKALCSYGCSCMVPTSRTGTVVVDALIAAGWTPPGAAGTVPQQHGRTLGTGRPKPPAPPTGESGVSRSPDGGGR